MEDGVRKENQQDVCSSQEFGNSKRNFKGGMKAMFDTQRATTAGKMNNDFI